MTRFVCKKRCRLQHITQKYYKSHVHTGKYFNQKWSKPCQCSVLYVACANKRQI